MKLTTEQLTALETASKPLIEFLRVNCNPHCQVIVDITHAVLMEDIAGTKPIPLAD